MKMERLKRRVRMNFQFEIEIGTFQNENGQVEEEGCV